MVWRLIGGFVVGLVTLLACSSKSGGGHSGTCGVDSGSSSTAGTCSGAASCGSPPCALGCQLMVSVVSGYPDTCSGSPDPCDSFNNDGPDCVKQGCDWSGANADCEADSGSEGTEGGYVPLDAAASVGTCSGKGPTCPGEPPCPIETCMLAEARDGGPTCAPYPCSDFSSTETTFGQPALCVQYGCTWTPE